MGALSRLRSLWSNLARRREVEAELDDELRAYVDLLTAEYEKGGMSPGAARRAALVASGGVELVKEETRDAWIGDSLATVARTLRHASRSLRRSPVYVVTAVLTLAIGIGAATALFTIVKGSLLRPLPAVAEPDRLVSIEPVRGSTILYDFSYLDFTDYRRQAKTLSGLALYDGTSMAFRTGAHEVGHAWVSYVSGDFFSVLGVRPQAGRLLDSADVALGAPAPVTVVGYDFAQSHFGTAAQAIGQTLWLDGTPLIVVGVAPPGFIGAMALNEMQIWIPLTTVGVIAHYPMPLESRTDATGRLVGRLAPGARVEDARRELTLIAARLAEAYPQDHDRTVLVNKGAGMTIEERAELSRMPRLLAGAVALLLIIACANVACLSIVRASARRRELATRLALGASRASLAGRLVAEHALLASVAALCGIAAAWLLVRWNAIVDTVVSMNDVDLSLDWRVLAVAAAAGVLTMLSVSVAPALEIGRVPPAAVLKDGGSAGRRRSRGQRAMVVVQVAAALVLLLSASLILGAVRRALRTDLGFDPRGVSIAFVRTHDQAIDSAGQLGLYQRVLARARTRPEVAAAGLAMAVPPAPWTQPSPLFRRGEEPPVGTPPDRASTGAFHVYVDNVYPGTLAAIGIPLLLGRDIAPADDDHAPRVAIVSQRTAAELWPHENPIGKYVVGVTPRVGRVPMRVVGVVGNTRYNGLTSEPAASMYVPYSQHMDFGDLTLVLRGRAGAIVPDSIVRSIVGATGPIDAEDLSRPLTASLAGQLVVQRRASTWLGAVGMVALLLAAIGLYGVIAQNVQQRARELAVRAAVGATPRMLQRLTLADGVRLTTFGVILGVLGAVLAVRVLRTMFTSLDFVDPRACLAAVAALVFVAIAASYLPARRAGRIDVMQVLRTD
jgi:putative ABC transport system permease protein